MKNFKDIASVNVTLVYEHEQIEVHIGMMKNSTKIGIKRKIELVESKPNKVTAVNKKKAGLKTDMMIKLKELQDKFDTLENENEENIDSLEQANEALDKNIEIIRCLKE